MCVYVCVYVYVYIYIYTHVYIYIYTYIYIYIYIYRSAWRSLDVLKAIRISQTPCLSRRRRGRLSYGYNDYIGLPAALCSRCTSLLCNVCREVLHTVPWSSHRFCVFSYVSVICFSPQRPQAARDGTAVRRPLSLSYAVPNAGNRKHYTMQASMIMIILMIITTLVLLIILIIAMIILIIAVRLISQSPSPSLPVTTGLCKKTRLSLNDLPQAVTITRSTLVITTTRTDNPWNWQRGVGKGGRHCCQSCPSYGPFQVQEFTSLCMYLSWLFSDIHRDF